MKVRGSIPTNKHRHTYKQKVENYLIIFILKESDDWLRTL